MEKDIENTAAPSVECRSWFADVLAELDRAKAKFPLWPDDPLHAVAILQEEVGELQKAVLERCYEFDKVSLTDIHNEAVQVMAMAARFLDSLMEYQFCRSDQHRQRVPCAACDRGDFQLGHADGCSANVFIIDCNKAGGPQTTETGWKQSTDKCGALTTLTIFREDDTAERQPATDYHSAPMSNQAL